MLPSVLDEAVFFFFFLEILGPRGGRPPTLEQDHPSLARVHSQSRHPKPSILYTAVFSICFLKVDMLIHMLGPHMSPGRLQVEEANPTPSH